MILFFLVHNIIISAIIILAPLSSFLIWFSSFLLWSGRIHPYLRKISYADLNFSLLFKKVFKTRFSLPLHQKSKIRVTSYCVISRNGSRNLLKNLIFTVTILSHLKAVWIDFVILKVWWLFRAITHYTLSIHNTWVSLHVQPQTTIAAAEKYMTEKNILVFK